MASADPGQHIRDAATADVGLELNLPRDRPIKGSDDHRAQELERRSPDHCAPVHDFRSVDSVQATAISTKIPLKLMRSYLS